MMAVGCDDPEAALTDQEECINPMLGTTLPMLEDYPSDSLQLQGFCESM